MAGRSVLAGQPAWWPVAGVAALAVAVGVESALPGQPIVSAVLVGLSALCGAVWGARGIAAVLAGFVVLAVFGRPEPVVVLGMPVAALVLAGAAGLWRIASARAARDRLAARAEAVAAERARVAREMHDSLGKTLDAIALGAAALPDTLDEPDRAGRLARVLRDGTLDAARDARAIIDGLRAHPADAPLPDLVGDIARGWSADTGVAVDLTVGAVEADPQTAVDLCWILREALRNVARHAGAARVGVLLLRREGDDVLLRVADDGVGFAVTGGPGSWSVADPGPVPEGGRYGLVGMAERAAAGGGELDVVSAPGRGTVITARMPIRPPGVVAVGAGRAAKVALLVTGALVAAAVSVALSPGQRPPSALPPAVPSPSAMVTRSPSPSLGAGPSASPVAGSPRATSSAAGGVPPKSSRPSAKPQPDAAACRVRYSIRNQWDPGFIADITVTNTGGTTVDGWTLRFAFPADQQLMNGWSATVGQSGREVTANDGGYHPRLAPGEAVTFGIQGTWGVANPAPSVFTLNGRRCG
ncbi:hypothetical protein Cme02nite_48070 [Catellatospora methionotrophica]|uniref:CBM2 domain-containing protein n=1 Tax=Catellatospora methionotrophica TaxID=121620 RepID=A0A8J3LD79_9ACTN|nr:cellulose binding domain-containing protein [Catellatospora methionotrophica]GIG16475.1 hypothetical protein Cme02nite_48070 [Catellatospora methionotrophica]